MVGCLVDEGGVELARPELDDAVMKELLSLKRGSKRNALWWSGLMRNGLVQAQIASPGHRSAIMIEEDSGN